MVANSLSNHALLNEGDLVLMYGIQNKINVNWIHVIKDHMLKSKYLSNYRFSYLIFVYKILHHFRVSVNEKLLEGIRGTTKSPMLHFKNEVSNG